MKRTTRPVTAQTVFTALVDACKGDPEGVTVPSIAKTIGRSPDAVRLRLREMLAVGAVRCYPVSSPKYSGYAQLWLPLVDKIEAPPKPRQYKPRKRDRETGAPLGTCEECGAEGVAVGEWKGRTLCRECLCPDTPIETVGWRTASPTSLF